MLQKRENFYSILSDKNITRIIEVESSHFKVGDENSECEFKRKRATIELVEYSAAKQRKTIFQKQVL